MRRPIVFVLLAGFAALVAAMIVYSALKKREAEVEKAMIKSIGIVVAAHDLGIGAKLDQGSLKTVRWSRDAMPPGAYTNPAPLLGQFTRTSFVENEPIVASRLFSGDKNAGVLPLLIPVGMRAISVPVDEVSDIAGFVLPHTRVDVLVSIASGDKQLSKIVLQNVEVLAIAQEIENVNDKPQPVRVVTMLVSPDQAERLTLASHEGALRLAMRNYQDNKVISTSGIDTAELLGAQPVAAPIPALQRIAAPRPRPKPVTVEVLRNGHTSESVSFVRTGAGAHSAADGVQMAPIGGSTAADRPDKAALISPDVTGRAVAGVFDLSPPATTALAPSHCSKRRPQSLGIVGSAEPVLIDGAAANPADAAPGAGYAGPHARTIDVP